MVVRFDNAAQKAAQETKDNMIGVEGDPATRTGGISETEAIVTGQATPDGTHIASISRATTDEVQEVMTKNQEPGPELNLAAAEAARKDIPRVE